MKNASKLLVAATLAASGALTSSVALAGPMGPSAKMAARLKKHPTSVWLAHYLPDDRYKIAGGVWKYVSTDLDTYYHRPDSALMMRQPAGRVIGFSSAQEAEEAGYIAGPGAQSGGALNFGAARSSSSPFSQAELQRILRTVTEMKALGEQIKADNSGNLPVLKQRLERLTALWDSLPLSSPGFKQIVRPISKIKSGMRKMISSINLHDQGNDVVALQQLKTASIEIQSANREIEQAVAMRRR